MKQRKPVFMIHKHQATHLHYDLRLEVEGKLKSWALRALPLKPNKPELAIMVPDHPFWYRHFEGVIPEGQYGAGPVMIWDKGLYSGFNYDINGKKISLEQSIKNGILMIQLEGHKLKGGYILVRITKKQRWLMIKMDDKFVQKGRKPINWDRSIKSDKTLEEIFESKNN